MKKENNFFMFTQQLKRISEKLFQWLKVEGLKAKNDDIGVKNCNAYSSHQILLQLNKRYRKKK